MNNLNNVMARYVSEPFPANFPFLYPLENIRKLEVLYYFQGLEKNVDLKWVKHNLFKS